MSFFKNYRTRYMIPRGNRYDQYRGISLCFYGSSGMRHCTNKPRLHDTLAGCRLLLEAANRTGRLHSSVMPEIHCSKFMQEYRSLGAEKQSLFQIMGTELCPSSLEIQAYARRLLVLDDNEENFEEKRSKLYNHLRRSLTPLSTQLFFSLASLPGGVKCVLDMRADLMNFLRSGSRESGLNDLSISFTEWVQEWCKLGRLSLKRINWDSPASLLEKVLTYSGTIHPMESWDIMRIRLGGKDEGRRCFGFFHEDLHLDPLVFIEVALTKRIEKRIENLTESKLAVPESEATTAMFYAIIAPQPGLTGIDLGHHLIVRVMNELQGELKGLRTFCTLSPMPGFRKWLETYMLQNDFGLWSKSIRPFLEAEDPVSYYRKNIEIKDIIMSLAARYILKEKRRGLAMDGVAHFHLRNGAEIWDLCWLGNPKENGMKQSCGVMVNYRYYPTRLVENNSKYLQGEVVASEVVQKIYNKIP